MNKAERMNLELEMALRCMAFQSPSSWPSQLLWVEYTAALPPASLHLNALMAFNHHFSQPRKMRFHVRPFKLSSVAAAEHGSRPVPPSSVLWVDIPPLPTAAKL